MRKIEIIRWWAAVAGIGLWFLYFEAQFEFMEAGRESYCAAREMAGGFCNYDYIPIMELFFIPIFLIIFAYPFARFAFGIFAPSFPRSLRWRFAGKIGAEKTYPVLQIIAVLGLFWSIFRLSALPIAHASCFAISYWIAWIIWFGIAIVASWQRREREI